MDLIDKLGLRPHIDFVSGVPRRAHRRALRRGRAGSRAEPLRGLQPARHRGDVHGHATRRHRWRCAARGHRRRRRRPCCSARPATWTRSPPRSRAASTTPSCGPVSARPDAGASSNAGGGGVAPNRPSSSTARCWRCRRTSRSCGGTVVFDVLTIRFDQLGLRPGDRVLDVGAGFGRHVFEAARRGASVVAARLRRPTRSCRPGRPSAAMVDAGEITVERFAGVLRGDATQLPFADGSFDVVITSEVLEHIQDDVAAIAEMVRVLKPGGALRGDGAELVPGEDQLDAVGRVPRAEERRWARPHLHARPSCRAKLRAAGLDITAAIAPTRCTRRTGGCRCAVGPHDDDHQRGLPGTASSSSGTSSNNRASTTRRRPAAVAGARQEHRALRRKPAFRLRWQQVGPRGSPHERPCQISPACSRADELTTTGDHLASLQLPTGMIPWFPGGHCDPWNHVESAMALDVVGLHDEAELGLRMARRHAAPGRQLAQLLPAQTERSRNDKLDTNVCAYIATGVWHHFRCTWDRNFRRRTLADRRAGARLGARPPPSRRHRPVGRRAARTAVGLRVAHRFVQHPARTAVRRLGRPRRRRRATRLDGRRRRVVERHRRAPRRLRAEDTAGRWTGTTRC